MKEDLQTTGDIPNTGYRWREGGYDVTRSVCWSPPGCHGGCGVLLYHREGRLVRVEGDEDNTFNRGRLCPRGLSITEFIDHPQRLRTPLIRTGQRGENRWREATFDEAIDVIAQKFTEIKQTFRPESVIFCKGTARDIGAWLPRLCYGFGSPNYFGFGPASGNACYRPRVAASTAIMGNLPIPDMGQFDSSGSGERGFQPPRCILIWGANPIYSNPDGLFGGWITDLMKEGTELIVVDPQRTWLASKAKHWLRIKPGADGALALGMIHQIFTMDLIDEVFCRTWVDGVEAVERAAADYNPDMVAALTGVDSDIITEATRFFARNKPVNLVWGVSVDMNSGCLGTISSLISLFVLTGNVEIPGGMVLQPEPFGVNRRGDDIEAFPHLKGRRIGAEEYPLIEIGTPYAQPDVLLNQMESEQPYPIRAAWLQGTSVVPSSFADPERVLKLFSALDFCVVVDILLTPAAVAFADVVLPAALWPEKDSIYVHFPQLGTINKAIEPPEQCRSDAEIILALGRKIAPEYFPWEDVRQWLDHRLEPSGMTFDDLRRKGSLTAPIDYEKHEKGKLRRDGKPGFDTPSGKIELDSSLFRQFNLDGKPHFNDHLSHYQDSYGRERYPFILTTGARRPYYFCAEHRHIASLRRMQPEPQVLIHPETAQAKGIGQGDTVRIDSPFGGCTMKADVSDRFEREVIHCDYGWWFPERAAAAPELFGVMESNVNALFPSNLQGPGGFGYPFRCFICSIEKQT